MCRRSTATGANVPDGPASGTVIKIQARACQRVRAAAMAIF